MGAIKDEFDRTFFGDQAVAEEKAKKEMKKQNGVSHQFMDGVMQQANMAMNAQMTAVAMGEYGDAKNLASKKAEKEIADDKKAKAELEAKSVSDQVSAKSGDNITRQAQASESEMDSSSIDRLDDERAKRQAHQEAVFDEKFSDKYNHMLEEESPQASEPQMGD